MKNLITLFILFIITVVQSFAHDVDNSFIQNNGQWDSKVLFKGTFKNQHVWITSTGVIFDHYKIEGTGNTVGFVHSMKFLNGAKDFTAKGQNSLQTKISYQQKGKLFSASAFERVLVKNVYKGIDVVFHSENGTVRYDFIVKPYADPQQISLRFEGIDDIEMKNSSLHFTTKDFQITNGSLRSFQKINNLNQHVESSFKNIDKKTFAFTVGLYDKSKVLIIDPIVTSSYFGTAQDDAIMAMTLDKAKNVIIVGWTNSTNLPTTLGSYNSQFSSGITDAFVAKLTPDMKSVIFSTYIGGSGADTAFCVKTDESNNIYVGGITSSADFGTTETAPDKLFGGQTDGFLIKLTESGSRVYSTFLGGTGFDKITALAVGKDNSVFTTGFTFSSNFPTTPGVVDVIYNSGGDAFATKIDANGTVFSFSTFLGFTVRNNEPAEYDCGYDITLNDIGDVLIVGETRSGSFPIYPIQGMWWEPAPPFLPIQNALKGISDGFIVSLNSNASTYRYSSYFGGNGEEKCTVIELTDDNRPVIAGSSNSPAGIIPITSGYQASVKGMNDCFLIRFSTDWKTQAFTFWGENRDEFPTDVKINSQNGEIYLSGETTSSLLLTTNTAEQKNFGGNKDGFITKFNSQLNQIVYSTYVGGPQIDVVTNIFIDNMYDLYYSVATNSTNSVNSDGYQSQSNGGIDGYIGKLVLKSLQLSTPQSNDTWCPGEIVTIQWNTDYPAGTEFEIFLSADTGKTYSLIQKTTTNSFQFTVPFTLNPLLKYSLKVKNISGIQSEIDNISISKVGTIENQPSNEVVCAGETAMFEVVGSGDNLQYEWRKGNQIVQNSADSKLIIPNATVLNEGTYTVTVKPDCGSDIVSQSVTLTVRPQTKVISTPDDVNITVGSTLSVCPTSVGLAKSYQWFFNGISMGLNFQNECLSIPNIGKSLEGEYYCIVTGTCGNDTSRKVMVSVKDAVSVRDELTNGFVLQQNGSEMQLFNRNNSLELTSLSIVSVLGTKQFITLPPQNKGTIAFSTSTLSSGMYLLEILTNHGRSFLPFTIVR